MRIGVKVATLPVIALGVGIGVGTWAWSPIKFQADLGILLTFMFLWNMLGALILLPALARLVLRPKELKADVIVTQDDVNNEQLGAAASNLV